MANPPQSFRFDTFLLLLVAAAYLLSRRLFPCGRLADVAFHDLPFMVFFLGAIWARCSPPESAALRWARFAIVVGTSSIIFGIARISAGPPTPEAVVWVCAAFCVSVLIVYSFRVY